MRQNTVCEVCKHMLLSHLAKCFVRGCECKEFVSQDEKEGDHYEEKKTDYTKRDK